MKKIVLLFVTLFMMTGFGFSQTVLYEDNLDSYALDSYLYVDNPTWWTTWSGGVDGESIQIKNTFSHSATMSGSADMTGGATDCILKLGNRVSGVYQLKWWMYIETGKCGYYNIQHFESPGIEWAYELYFRTNGDIHLLQGGNTLNGTYPKDTWFEVQQDIDLDADLVSLFVNGVNLGQWPISDEALNPGGTKQLGGVDFFAGAEGTSGETPGFYVDDVYFAEIVAGSDPIIGVDPVAVSKWLLGGTTGTENLTVLNTGTDDLTYDINIVYDVDGLKSSPVQTATNQTYSVKRVLANIIADPTPGDNQPYPGTDATAQLHYDGEDVTNSVGWGSPPITVTVAARFLSSMCLPYAGMEVTSVEVYINDLNANPSHNAMKIKLFDMGNTYEPGAQLYEQNFTPSGASWEVINLTTPVMVNGGDLWVGYEFLQNDASIYIAGVDEGPANENGNFLTSGVGWTHLSSTIDANWHIRANLTGDPIVHWLTATPMSGTVAPAAFSPVVLGFNELLNLDLGTYGATVKLLSNDPVTPVLDVPVTLVVAGVGIPEIDKLGVMIYPNPTQEKLNIVTNGAFNKATITDFTGKVVFVGNSKTIDISNLSNGVYFVKVETAQGISNTKFVKN